MVIFSAIAFIIYKKVASIHASLFFEAYGNSIDLIKTGIFKEIWVEYEDNQFEGLFDFKTKIKFMEMHNNLIEIIIVRNHHEIVIEINEKEINFAIDEVGASAKYDSILFESLYSLDDFYILVRDFINIYT